MKDRKQRKCVKDQGATWMDTRGGSRSSRRHVKTRMPASREQRGNLQIDAGTADRGRITRVFQCSRNQLLAHLTMWASLGITPGLYFPAFLAVRCDNVTELQPRKYGHGGWTDGNNEYVTSKTRHINGTLNSPHSFYIFSPNVNALGTQ